MTCECKTCLIASMILFVDVETDRELGRWFFLVGLVYYANITAPEDRSLLPCTVDGELNKIQFILFHQSQRKYKRLFVLIRDPLFLVRLPFQRRETTDDLSELCFYEDKGVRNIVAKFMELFDRKGMLTGSVHKLEWQGPGMSEKLFDIVNMTIDLWSELLHHLCPDSCWWTWNTIILTAITAGVFVTEHWPLRPLLPLIIPICGPLRELCLTLMPFPGLIVVVLTSGQACLRVLLSDYMCGRRGWRDIDHWILLLGFSFDSSQVEGGDILERCLYLGLDFADLLLDDGWGFWEGWFVLEKAAYDGSHQGTAHAVVILVIH